MKAALDRQLDYIQLSMKQKTLLKLEDLRADTEKKLKRLREEIRIAEEKIKKRTVDQIQDLEEGLEGDGNIDELELDYDA